MSARDALYANLMAVNTTLSPGDPVVINRLLDAYAHELAEKQRQSDVGDCCEECAAAVELAARLIDPEVSDG